MWNTGGSGVHNSGRRRGGLEMITLYTIIQADWYIHEPPTINGVSGDGRNGQAVGRGMTVESKIDGCRAARAM